MKILINTFSKRSFVILFVIFISCDENLQESCPEPINGEFISVVDKGEMTIDYIEGLKPSYGLPDDFVISYDIKIYSVDYKTTDPDGNEAIASGAIYIPMNTGKESLSLISGQHGLTIKKRCCIINSCLWIPWSLWCKYWVCCYTAGLFRLR